MSSQVPTQLVGQNLRSPHMRESLRVGCECSATRRVVRLSPRLLDVVGDLPEQVCVQQNVRRNRLIARATKNLALPSRRNRPVAGKRCHDAPWPKFCDQALSSSSHRTVNPVCVAVVADQFDDDAIADQQFGAPVLGDGRE
jgi:hypothetical protein